MINRTGPQVRGLGPFCVYGDFMKRCITMLLRLLIRFYQLAISPLKPGCCRYYPTCSTYTLQAIEKYGPLKGSWMGLKRILRCHPFHKGGYDPVP